MRKKWLLGLVAVPLVLLTSCLFMLQGFIVLDGNLGQGEKTKARFILRPATMDNERVYQFVVVGVTDGGDLKVGKATWGTNGKFGGDRPMPVSAPLPAAMDASGECATSGFDFSSVSGITWKAFMIQIRTKGKVNQTARVDAVVKATQAAGTDAIYSVIGVTGIWVDDGDSVVNASDNFLCSGAGTSSIYVHA
jgi:hypothetical protein